MPRTIVVLALLSGCATSPPTPAPTSPSTVVWTRHSDCPRSTISAWDAAVETRLVASAEAPGDEPLQSHRSKQRWHLENDREVVSASWRPFCVSHAEICGVAEMNCRYNATVEKVAGAAQCEQVENVSCFHFRPVNEVNTQVRCARSMDSCRRLKTTYVTQDRALEDSDCFVLRYDPVDAEPCPTLGRTDYQ